MAPLVEKIVAKYRTEGITGFGKSVLRRVFAKKPPADNSPVRFVLDEILPRDRFVIVQIGAYIGDSWSDPLYRHIHDRIDQNNGLLICVEPVGVHFQKLVKNYNGLQNVRFENVAIADFNGTSDFYRLGVNPEDFGYPEWLSQLGSLKKERMGKMWDEYEGNDEMKAFYLKHRVKDTVECITLEELLKRHGVTRVDLLTMDVEGYEFEILKTLNLDKYDIRFLNFESVLLLDNKPKAVDLVTNMGFNTVDYDQDTFCYHDSDADLIQKWKAETGEPGLVTG